MGAYYTKEDITDTFQQEHGDSLPVRCSEDEVQGRLRGRTDDLGLLQDDPDRYIYAAVKHGVTDTGRVSPSRRKSRPALKTSPRDAWNRAADAEFALPTEIWREVVARRTRMPSCAEASAGEVREINDLITLNLDIRQFAQDVIDACEGPELLRAFWKAIGASRFSIRPAARARFCSPP